MRVQRWQRFKLGLLIWNSREKFVGTATEETCNGVWVKVDGGANGASFSYTWWPYGDVKRSVLNDMAVG